MMNNSRRVSWEGPLFLAVVLIAGLPLTARAATTYYVSQDGSDANDGQTLTTAWQTLARVNAAQLAPGDVVVLRCGDTWREQLLPVSGDESGYVTYGAYGDGPKPLLLGSIEKNAPEDWRDEGNNIWATVGPVPAGEEILQNPSFSDGVSDWNLHTEQGASAQGARDAQEHDSAPACYRLHCTKSGTAGSHMQLYTATFSVVQGTVYRLIFKAKASEPFLLAPPHLHKSGPPWSNYASGNPLPGRPIGTSWAVYTQYYEATATADDARLTFFLGGALPEGATFYLDTLSLVPCNGSALLPCDVGNIIFDGEASCGVKVWNEGDLDTQGEYWYDEDRHVLKLYSTECPATHYADIECAIRRHIIDQSNRSYVSYENLALKYGAAHGIGGGNTHHIIVRACDLGYIGGGDQRGGDATVRYGNGIEFWGNAHDSLVERCRLWEVYDAALTNQNNAPNVKQYNIRYRKNLIWNCEYSFEYWNRPENSVTRDIYFEHNTCVNAGYGWGHTQRPDPSGRHLCFYTSPAVAEGIYIRNNIFFEAKANAFYAPTWDQAGVDALVMDNNCWLQSAGDMISVSGARYTMDQFAAYQTDKGKEPHSITGDPQLVDAARRDFHLAGQSPCVDAGADVGHTSDYEGTAVPQGAAPDIGAYESRPK